MIEKRYLIFIAKNQNGEFFIIEMQKAEQDYFIDRTIYYSTFPIQNQGEKGREWQFKLKRIYTVGILDFIFENDSELKTQFSYMIK